MPAPGDYEDEMGLLSSEQVEAVLSGRPPQDPVGVRAGVAVAEVRIALSEEPPPPVAARHLAAMFEAAGRARSVVKSRPSRSLPARSRRVAAMTLAATLVLGVGIGAALTLPGELPQTAGRARRASAQEVYQAGGSGGSAETAIVPSTGATPVRGGEVVSERGTVISDTARKLIPAGCVRSDTLAGLPPVGDTPAAVSPRDPCTATTTVPPQEEVAPGTPGPPDVGAVDDRVPIGSTEGEVPGRQGSPGGGAGEPPAETEKPGAGEGGSEPGESRTGPGDTLPIDPEELLPI